MCEFHCEKLTGLQGLLFYTGVIDFCFFFNYNVNDWCMYYHLGAGVRYTILSVFGGEHTILYLYK